MIQLLKKENCFGKIQISMLQKHSNKIVVVSNEETDKMIRNCDGLVTNDSKFCLRISVADCIPLAIYDPVTNSIGLAHAGWRGLYKGIIKNLVCAMKSNFSASPENLLAEIGPHICPKHYEVKKDVSSKFVLYKNAVIYRKDNAYLNLSAVARSQLEKCGIKKENIEVSTVCTYEDSSLASYRRGERSKSNYFFLSLDR